MDGFLLAQALRQFRSQKQSPHEAGRCIGAGASTAAFGRRRAPVWHAGQAVPAGTD